LSSVPPDDQPPYQQEEHTTPGGEQRPYGGGFGTTFDMARMPIPGNAELLVWLLALIVAAIVAAIADEIDANGWFQFFLFTTVAYLLSRGIAKASRVLEQ
jgi:hypothetical protein